jgi:hypothetical protein
MACSVLSFTNGCDSLGAVNEARNLGAGDSVTTSSILVAVVFLRLNKNAQKHTTDLMFCLIFA